VTATTGLMAGFFYAYEVSVMRGLNRLDDAAFVAAMQAINDSVRNLPFALGFWGALVLGGLTAAALRRHGPAGRMAAVAGVVYAVGVVAVTARYSLNLNDALAAVAGQDPVSTADARAAFEGDWVAWNRVRLAAAVTAFAGYLAVPYSARR
jgi:uncharacterized membrane protein